jgi:uncharacterized membrane protein YbaN (DUF454 family)
MEQQKLPNSTLVLVMGILSIVGCCFYGLPGLIFGIVAIIFGRKDKKLFQSNPDEYTGIGNVNAGYIMGIIGVILSILYLAMFLIVISMFGWDVLTNQELLQEKLLEMQQNQ